MLLFLIIQYFISWAFTAGVLWCIFALLDKHKMPPKIMRPIYPKPGSESTVVLVEAMRAASHGLTIESPIFVLGADGRETEELLEAYKIEENEKCPS